MPDVEGLTPLVPGRSDDEAADRDGAQLRLRSGGPVFVFDVDRLDEQVAAERRGERARAASSRDSADREERAEPGRVVRLLNGGGLKVVELGEHEILQLRIAARHMNVERGPGLTQKYL